MCPTSIHNPISICISGDDGLLGLTFRAVFIWVSKSNWFCVYYATRLVKKKTRHFFIQSGVKPKPIVIYSYVLSRALRQLHVITSCFDWFTWLSVSFVIG